MNKDKSYSEIIKGYYFGILKDYEKGEKYSILVDKLLEELFPFYQFEYGDFDIVVLYSKTASLKYLNYKTLRKVILKDCMTLVDKIFKV